MERKSAVNLRVSDEALREAAEIEGFVPYAYDDKDPKPPARKTFITFDLVNTVQGTLTKGHGHTRTTKPGDRVTREEALSLLRSDARDAESCVHRYVKVPLTQGEFDGIWDLFFNVGPGSLPNDRWPNGKDGIACLGRSGEGRPSTLLTKLNEGRYDEAAECFTQWRNKGTIWEWGLTKRRIRFMLLFLGLPLVRAMNALPNVAPATDAGRFGLVQKCIALGREEAEDQRATAMPAPAPDPIPAPDPPLPDPLPLPDPPAPEILLDKPLPPTATPPAPEKPADPATSSPAGVEGPAAARQEAPRPLPPPEIIAPKPPPPPVIIAPKSVDVRAIPYGEITPENGAKNMSESQRGVGMVIVGIGSLVQIVTMRLGVATAAGAIFFDLSRDPVVIALAATAVAVVIGWATRKRGTKVMTKGMIDAKQVLK